MDSLLFLNPGEDGFNPLDPNAGGNAFWTWLIFIPSLFILKDYDRQKVGVRVRRRNGASRLPESKQLDQERGASDLTPRRKEAHGWTMSAPPGSSVTNSRSKR